MGLFSWRKPGRWAGMVGAVAGAHLLVSLLAPRSSALTAFGDLTQCLLLLAATLAMLSNIRSGSKRTRLFWGWMALGCGMWLCAQLLWTYFEVLLHQEVPNPFVGDVCLFLHIVPMMAALVLQPHLRRKDRSLQIVSVDSVLLLSWWLFLYLFVVIPWQYVSPNEAVYGRSFNLLYACEQLVLIAGAAVVWRRSRGAWTPIYAQLVGAAVLYSTGSVLASVAIDFHRYYTGSFYDIPLVAAMAWFAAIGFMARKSTGNELPCATDAPPAGHEHSIWTARLAMLAVFSTPLMVAWAEFGGDVPARVRGYRLYLTVAAMIFMGVLVFIKQQWTDRELLNLLRLSRINLEEMCQLRDELQSKEQSLRWHSLELQRKNLELQEISYTDALTGVWNRRYLEEILAAEAGQVLRNYDRASDGGTGGLNLHFDNSLNHRDLVFLMVDVDFFKEVNDRHGHPAGDLLLQRVAARLTRVVRKSDVLVRWGGEEFLIMSRSADPAGTPAFCERVLDIMASELFDLGKGVRVRKTCSVGWAAFPWSRNAYETLCAEETIELADAALYRAKAAGRNQGVGILASDAVLPEKNVLEILKKDSGVFTRMVRVCNSAESAASRAYSQIISSGENI